MDLRPFRDKEVYARYLEQNRWSDEIHVSPEDILPADDHTDPVIAPSGSGVVIGWSWDFHHVPENLGYSQVPQEPSIFLRSVEAGPKLQRAGPSAAQMSTPAPQSPSPRTGKSFAHGKALR